MSTRNYSLPADLEKAIAHQLQTRFRRDLKDSRELAEAIKRLSDFFIREPDGQTPWSETWAQVAYLAYFLPLNFIRVQSVVKEARSQNFFKGLNEVIDFGAGLGTASLALQEDFSHFQLVERSHKICSQFQFLPKAAWTDRPPEIKNPAQTLAVFSYSLTEVTELPPWAGKVEALMILEPATQQDGRQLLQLRQKMLDLGYHAWAPCTHQQACPLLSQSKTDWCHDRIHFQAPPWFQKLEEHLPMKNKTLTMSYLLLRKTPPPARAANTARTIGDLLKEKGKDRQMLCRGPEREFLAWLHKQGPHDQYDRGVLVEIPTNVQKVANELRLADPKKS